MPTCTDTDSVDDTPNQWGPNFGKPMFPSASCDNTPNGDLFMNYMDYVDDDTMVMFTTGQVTRMHAALEFSRPDLGRVDVPDQANETSDHPRPAERADTAIGRREGSR